MFRDEFGVKDHLLSIILLHYTCEHKHNNNITNELTNLSSQLWTQQNFKQINASYSVYCTNQIRKVNCI
jgi:hypothetical protein